MTKRFPWIHAGKKTDPELPYEPPIPLGDFSNGEFFHEQTPREAKMKKEILRRCDENARKVGMDRRDFIASTMGMATTLAVINAASGCTGSDSGGSSRGLGDGGSGGSGSGGAGSGGGYNVPDAAQLDCGLADEVMSGNEFILDMQTHHVEDEEHWRETHGTAQPYPGNAIARALTFYACPELQTDSVACVGPDKYLEAIFLNSDTTVAVLSGFPGAICEDTTLCGHVISNEDMVSSRDRINAASGSQRMVQHCQVMPNDRWDLQAQAMERINREHGNHGWKVYPGSGGWWMDDPAVAYPFYEKAVELGQPVICSHKGLLLPGFIPEYLDPKDVGPAAVDWPQLKFVIYHSAVELGNAEGAYDPAKPTAELRGMDKLIRTVEEHDLKDKNVYAEMGSAWYLQMNSAVAAQHYIGKALKYLGEDRLVWGSECVWFNSPQPQIEAFRSFQISQEFQDLYGYPAITDAIRRKIFGLSAAQLYGIDAAAARNPVQPCRVSTLKQNLDGELGGRRWMFQKLGGPRTRREFFKLLQWKKFSGQPA